MPEQPLPARTGSTHDHLLAVEIYKCDNCGLCCRHLLVEADWSDVLRDPRIAQECPNLGAKHVPLLEQYWLLSSEGKGGACPFLGDDQKCGIYPTRPGACVTFAAGSTKCQELRAEAGLPLVVAGMGADLADQINAAVIDYDRVDAVG